MPMRALAVLAREHEAIARMLAHLEAELEALPVRGEIDAEAVERLLVFFERQVDGQHQEKEERVFLPCLLAHARGPDAALAREALGQHAEDRARLVAMRSHIEGAAYGDPGSLAEMGRQARGYIRHQREHSRWEQGALFALAHRVLSPGEEGRLLEGFQAFDEGQPESVISAAGALTTWLARRRAPTPVPAVRWAPRTEGRLAG